MIFASSLELFCCESQSGNVVNLICSLVEASKQIVYTILATVREDNNVLMENSNGFGLLFCLE